MFQFITVLCNITKIRSTLLIIFETLNTVNDPKDFEKIIKVVRKIQDILRKILIILGANMDEVKIEGTFIPTISKALENLDNVDIK